MEREIINSRFRAAINFLVKEKELKKAEIATRLGIKPSTFSEILNKRMSASPAAIAILCAAYGFSPAWLLCGEGNMLKTDNTPAAPAINCSRVEQSFNRNDSNLIDMLRTSQQQTDRALTLLEKLILEK